METMHMVTVKNQFKKPKLLNKTQPSKSSMTNQQEKHKS